MSEFCTLQSILSSTLVSSVGKGWLTCVINAMDVKRHQFHKFCTRSSNSGNAAMGDDEDSYGFESSILTTRKQGRKASPTVS